MPYTDGERQREYNRQWMRLWRAGECGTRGTQIPLAFRIETASHVLDLLSDQIEQVCSDEETRAVDRARTVGYLCGITLKAVEVTDLAARLEALETALKVRKAS